MALVTSAERLAWFQSARGVTLTAAQTTFLDLIQPWVEQACYLVIGYPVEQATFTEFLPASSGERPPLEFGIDVGWDRIGGVVMPRSRMDPSSGVLQLTRLPVRSVTSVYENLGAWTTGVTDGYWPTASLLPATGYRLDMSEPGLSRNGRLIRTVGSWLTTPRCVKVTYVAGYASGEISGGTASGTFGPGPLKMAVLDTLGWWWGKAMRRSASVNSNMLLAFNLTIRDFNVTLGDPAGLGRPAGDWMNSILSPEAQNLLMGMLNMAKYLG